MSQVLSFEDYTPAARFDAIPWSEVRIGEASTVTGTYTIIDTIALVPLDADPANPQSRDFTTNNASDTVGLWYQLTFADASGNTLAPLFPVQNVVSRPYYATAEELAPLVNVRDGHVDENRVALERVLAGAAFEIDKEVGPTDANGDTTPYASPPDIVVQVNLERAVEHWSQMKTSFGLVGLLGETTPAFASTDSWRRHAETLSFLKGSWGIA